MQPVRDGRLVLGKAASLAGSAKPVGGYYAIFCQCDLSFDFGFSLSQPSSRHPVGWLEAAEPAPLSESSFLT